MTYKTGAALAAYNRLMEHFHQEVGGETGAKYMIMLDDILQIIRERPDYEKGSESYVKIYNEAREKWTSKFEEIKKQAMGGKNDKLSSKI